MGSRVGLLISDDRKLHVFLNGIDMGVECTGIPDRV